MKKMMIFVTDDTTVEDIHVALYEGDIICPVYPEPYPEIFFSSNGTQRMTAAQRDKLWALCGGYNVPFREDDYFPTQFGSNAPKMYEGWIGGNAYSSAITSPTKRATIYVGVEPDGSSHS